LRLLLSDPAGGGGAASSVAGGQDPVLRRGHGETGIRLQSPSSRPSNPRTGGLLGANVLWSPV